MNTGPNLGVGTFLNEVSLNHPLGGAKVYGYAASFASFGRQADVLHRRPETNGGLVCTLAQHGSQRDSLFWRKFPLGGPC